MSKTISAVIITAIVCVGIVFFIKEKQIKNLKTEKTELIKSIDLRDSITGNLESLFYDIENNLRLIKEKRNQIIIAESEGRPDSKEKLLKDIMQLNQLLGENEAKVENLEKKLKQSGLDLKNFQKRIEVLNENITVQNKEIIKLKDIIRGKDYEMADLNETIDELGKNIISQIDTITNKQKIIDEQAYLLNSGYYIVGTRKELKETGLLESSGFLGLKKVQNKDNINDSIFTKIDISTTTSIPLHIKKAKIHTNHPSDSYIFNKEGDQIMTLEIVDKKEFWKISKYIVIEVK